MNNNYHFVTINEVLIFSRILTSASLEKTVSTTPGSLISSSWATSQLTEIRVWESDSGPSKHVPSSVIVSLVLKKYVKFAKKKKQTPIGYFECV